MLKDEYFEKTNELAEDIKKYLAYIVYIDENGNPKADICYNALAQALYEIGYRKTKEDYRND